jgi:hypothetical protein
MDIGVRRGLAGARAIAGDKWRALLVYVAIGVALPFALLSSEPIFSLRTVMAMIASPYSAYVSGSIAGPLYLLAIVSVIVAGAMLAAWNAIFAEIREGFVSEIMFGMVAGAAFLPGYLVVYAGAGVLGVPPMLGSVGCSLGIGLAGGAIDNAYRLFLSLLGTWIGARLCLTGAIMGAGGRLEPFSAFAESWRLTRDAQWRLFAFYLLYGLVVAAAFGALVVLHGAVIWNNAQASGSPLETAMSFGWLLLFAAYFLGQILIPAGLYSAAGPRTAVEVFT